MRFVHGIGAAVLEFIETSPVGAKLFRYGRFLLFAMVIFVASRVAATQFLSFDLFDLLFITVTALVFMVILWRWEIGVVLILCTTSFIFYYDYLPTLSLYHFIPEIRILEPLRLQIGQGIMLFLLVAFAASLEVRTVKERLATPLVPVVLLFLLVVSVAAVRGLVFGGVALSQMVENSRMFSFYLMFFVVLFCIRGRRQLDFFLFSCYVMAMIVAILMCVQFAVGERFRVFLGTNIRVESFGSFAGRILPPGSDLIWMVIPFVIAGIPVASARYRKWMVASLGLLLGGLLLTFTRTVWISTLVSMGLMVALGRGAVRRGAISMFAATLGFVLVLFTVLNLLSSGEESYVTPYVKRFTSIFHPESYGETTSAGFRWMEVREAWPKVAEKPWLGIGIGAVYRYEEAWDDAAQLHYMRAVSYMHNGYMLLLTGAGFLGLVAGLIMYATFFYRAIKIYGMLQSPVDQALVLACIASVASILIGAMMQPTIAASHDTPMVGAMFGIVELLRYFRRRESAPRSVGSAHRSLRRNPGA